MGDHLNTGAAWLAILGQQERALTYCVWQGRLASRLMDRIDSWLDLIWTNRVMLAEAGLLDDAMQDVLELVSLAEEHMEVGVGLSESNLKAVQEMIGAVA